MIKMFKVVKGILYRMISNKAYLMLPFVITPIVIAAAIYFSSSMALKPNIGVIGVENINLNSSQVNITKLENKVPLSDLVKNKYDAVISYSNGKVKIYTIKGDDYKNKIERVIKGEETTFKEGEKRGVATNIVGFLTMFIIILGVMLYKFFFDDKKGISNRVLSSNVTYIQYILSHFISVFIMIFIPTSVITVVLKEGLGLNTSVISIELVFIILILSLLSSAFGLFISSAVKQSESASMLGIMINVITTLIAGSFFTISNNNIIKTISKILPQKHILDFTIALENSRGFSYNNILSVLIITIIMLVFSVVINRYKMRRYNCM